MGASTESAEGYQNIAAAASNDKTVTTGDELDTSFGQIQKDNREAAAASEAKKGNESSDDSDCFFDISEKGEEEEQKQ